MTMLFSRWLPTATLAAWAGILLFITLGGRIGNGGIRDYLAPAFIPGVLVAGIALAAMALAFALSPAAADCCADDDCAHPLSRFRVGRLLTFFVLLLPVAFAPFASKAAFLHAISNNRTTVTDGSMLTETSRIRELKRSAAAAPAATAEPTAAPGLESAGAAGSAASADPASETAASSTSRASLDLPLPTKDGAPAAPAPVVTAAEPQPSDYLTRTPDGFIVAEVLDLLYAAQDNALRKDFEGKPVQLIGQLMPETSNNATGTRFKAVRMFMTCCAADARPVATVIEAEKLPALPEMTWVKITGIQTFPLENGRRIAVLKADHVEKADPPEESMLF